MLCTVLETSDSIFYPFTINRNKISKRGINDFYLVRVVESPLYGTSMEYSHSVYAISTYPPVRGGVYTLGPVNILSDFQDGSGVYIRWAFSDKENEKCPKYD